jgi:hypothetical protein
VPVDEQDRRPAFEPGDPNAIRTHAALIAQTVLSYVTEPFTNHQAMQRSARLTEEAGILESTLFGSTAEVDHFGHVLIFNGGDRGFLRFEVHNDKAYVEPLLLRKGRSPRAIGIPAAGICTLTKVCTNTIDLSGGPSTHDFDDQGAEDPAAGILPAYQYATRNDYDPQEIDLVASILQRSAELLAEGGDYNTRTLGTWLDEQTTHLSSTRAYVGVSHSGTVTWYDWLVLMSNGSSVLVQVASGEARPLFALAGQLINPLEAAVSFDTVATNVREQSVVFPHVTRR